MILLGWLSHKISTEKNIIINATKYKNKLTKTVQFYLIRQLWKSFRSDFRGLFFFLLFLHFYSFDLYLLLHMCCTVRIEALYHILTAKTLVTWATTRENINITKTSLYNFDPLKPYFYIVKLGCTGVYIIFLISAQKHRLLELPHGVGSNEYPQSIFWAEIWKIAELFIWKFSFFGGKISVYLNRHVFVMTSDMCTLQKLKSVCTSGQSDQSLLSCEETLHPWLSRMWPVKILTRLHECAGWSESLLGAFVRRYVFWQYGSLSSLIEHDYY